MPYTYPGDFHCKDHNPLRVAFPSVWEIQDIKCRKCGTTVRPSLNRGALFALELHNRMWGHD